MKPLFRLLIAALLVAALPLTGASAEAARTYELQAGASQGWEGPQTLGINTNYHGNHDTDQADVDAAVREHQPVGTCTTDPTTYCDLTLVSLTNPVPETDSDGKLSRPVTFTVRNAKGDLDLRIYESDAEGTRGTFIGQSAGPLDTLDHTDLDETYQMSVVTTRPTLAKPDQPEVSTKWYLVEVVYYAGAGYTGGVAF